MPLRSGEKLGPYEIVEAAGAWFISEHTIPWLAASRSRRMAG